MLSVSNYAGNYASFNFDFTTSDGDKISLSLTDYLDVSSSYKKGRNYISEEFSLKHQYGYEFHYEGNGLSEQDKKEIKEAFKKIEPLFKKFLDQKDKNDKIAQNIIHHAKSLLPQPKNENHQNAIKQAAVDSFDNILKQIKATLDEVKKTKEFFDKLFNDENKLNLFA